MIVLKVLAWLAALALGLFALIVALVGMMVGAALVMAWLGAVAVRTVLTRGGGTELAPGSYPGRKAGAVPAPATTASAPSDVQAHGFQQTVTAIGTSRQVPFAEVYTVFGDGHVRREQ